MAKPVSIGAFVQARMSSARLPGKVLTPVEGRPMLEYLLDRLAHCEQLDGIVVLTSDQPSDDPIQDFCTQHSQRCFRGSLENVAARFEAAASAIGWQAFVRISGDSPLLDQKLVDRAVTLFREEDCDLVTNVYPRTFPRGQSVEVLKTATFASAVSRMSTPAHREHVTPFFYEHHQDFRIRSITSLTNLNEVHLSVDTKADLDAFARMVASFEKPHWQYHLDEVVAIYEQLHSSSTV